MSGGGRVVLGGLVDLVWLGGEGLVGLSELDEVVEGVLLVQVVGLRSELHEFLLGLQPRLLLLH